MTRDYDATIAIFAATGWTCGTCGGPVRQYGTPQLAHRIADTKANRHKYGPRIIDSPRNVVPVCSLRCNDAQNIGGNPGACDELVKEIEGADSFDRAEAILTGGGL